MSSNYTENQKERIYLWNQKNLDRRRELARKSQKKRNEWLRICKVLNSILLELDE